MVKAICAIACSTSTAFLLFAMGMGIFPPKTSSAGEDGVGTLRRAVEPLNYSRPQYRLGPEDILHVFVWDNMELTLDVVVRPDGKISMPLLQDVQAEGLTA